MKTRQIYALACRPVNLLEPRAATSTRKTAQLARQRVLRLFAGLSIALVVGASAGASPVKAHNSLDSSDPAAGAILTSIPTVWTLTFTGVVPLDSASAEIISSDGTRSPLNPPRQGNSSKQIVFDLPPDLSGDVTGRWRLVGTDGHVITSRVRFIIEAMTTTTLPGAISISPSTTVAPVDVSTASVDEFVAPGSVRFGIRTANYAAILILGGLLFTDAYVARGVLRARRAREFLLGGVGLAAITPLLQTMIFLDDSRDFGVMNSVVHLFEAFDTTAGSMTLVRFLIGIALSVAVWRNYRDDSLPLLTPLTGTLAGLYLVALAYTGHSRSMAWPVLGIPADIIHTAAIAIWLGGLVVFIAFVIPSLQPAESFSAFRRFGDAATYAVIAMVVTGVIQTLRLHGSFLTLFTQSHGRWLLLKLVFVAFMLKIGDINRRRLVRALPQSEVDFARRVSLLRRASITEIVNGAVVMLITAVLVSASFD